MSLTTVRVKLERCEMEDKRQDPPNWQEKQQREDPKDTAELEREKLEQSRKDSDQNSGSKGSRR